MGKRMSQPAEPSAARKRFLDAARKEFAAKGYAGASIRAIAGSLHMRESAFYAHFKSKQEAYDLIFREAGPGVIAVLAQNVDPTLPMHTELVRLAKESMNRWTSSQARISTSIVLREVFSEGGRKRNQMLKGVSAALDVLQDKFERWQQQGYIAGHLDARTLAFQFVAPMVTSRLLFFTVGSSAADRALGRKTVNRHVETFLQLVSTKRPTS